MIRLEGVNKTFRLKKREVKALKDINLIIEDGSIFGIIGSSGAGKSTLVRCLNLLERPTSGKVFLDEVELTSLKKSKLREERRKIGMVFQQFNLLAQRNALMNVCYPLEIAGVPIKEAKKRAIELLKLVGLEDRMQNYPAQLSGGQKQRVAIARALATEPKYLLCDEATSALDPTTTKAILALLKEINEKYGITIVIITHEMAVVQEICTHVAIVDSGNLAETGTVEEVFSRPKSSAARKLVFQDENGKYEEMTGKRCIRIVFKSNSSFEPVIANMVLACKAPVNILLADTKDIGGVAHGQMILQLPDEAVAAEKMIQYLRDRNLEVEELKNYVG